MIRSLSGSQIGENRLRECARETRHHTTLSFASAFCTLESNAGHICMSVQPTLAFVQEQNRRREEHEEREKPRKWCREGGVVAVERVGRGCVARPEERGGRCTLKEAVVVRRQWEKSKTLGLRKGEDTGEEESCEGRTEGEGDRSRVRDGRSGSQEPYKELRAYS